MRIILTTRAQGLGIGGSRLVKLPGSRPPKQNGLPMRAARFANEACISTSGARGALFQALNVLAVELICNPEADAGHPDHQQNLPSLHKFLPNRCLRQNLQ
jgi:hypothetical protein